MTDFTDMYVQAALGPGHKVEDANPTPRPFRGIPIVVGGVPPATPAGATVLTGSPASTIPSPK
jgi:hypothetical protein